MAAGEREERKNYLGLAGLPVWQGFLFAKFGTFGTKSANWQPWGLAVLPGSVKAIVSGHLLNDIFDTIQVYMICTLSILDCIRYSYRFLLIAN